MIVLAAGLLRRELSRTDDQTADSAGGFQAQTSRNMAHARYFRTSQWRADARTLIAALDFLLTPECGNTNHVSARA